MRQLNRCIFILALRRNCEQLLRPHARFRYSTVLLGDVDVAFPGDTARYSNED